MYPGDEDNGSMGAWFVMNMLGFYRTYATDIILPLSTRLARETFAYLCMFASCTETAVSPASGNYTIGSPMFAKVTIDTGGKPFIISAKNQSPDKSKNK